MYSNNKSGTKRILAVDDEVNLLKAIERVLVRAGFDVQTAVSGTEALRLIERHGLPHLAVVDLNMPGMDGFEFCKAVHEYSDLPVIMLTAIHDEATVVEGLQEHAEDYITKDAGSFRQHELVARINRVLRRIGDFSYTINERIVPIDEDLQIDFPNRLAFVKNAEVQLTPTETKLLYILIRNAGRTVTNDFLLRRVWPLDEAYEDRLHTHIYRLRRKIEEKPKEPHYIVSKWGTGYSFLANSG